MNIQEEILKIRNELLDDFDKRVEALQAEEQEFPQDGDEYWYIDSEGWIDGPCEYLSGDDWDVERLLIGNVFKTKAEAEFAVEKLKVEAELREFGKPFESGDVNYCILGDLEGGRVAVMCRAYLPTQGTIYFESAEKAQQAIEEIGEDRIKKYIFGVEY